MSKYQLRPYQELDVLKSIQNNGILNANPPGVGKTLETLDALSRLPGGTTLVLCPKMATGVWMAEAEQWLDWDSLRSTGEYKPIVRANIYKEYDKVPSRLFIANIQMLKEILMWRSSWDNLVIDEAHLLGLLNHESTGLKSILKIKYRHIFILTGTPIRRGPQDLWPMLHLLDPKKFRSYWGFVNRYCVVVDGRFGKDILNRPKDPIAFHNMLNEYMIRHKKEDILKDLPPKMVLGHEVLMNDEQLRVAKEIEENMMAEIGDDLLVTPSTLSQILRLRQLMVCPKLIGGKTYGTAIDSLVTYLIPEEFEQGRSVAIATSFRQAIPFIKEALIKEIPDVDIFEIHGQIKETAQSVAAAFQACRNTKKVIIYSIKSGASWTATDASTGFMLGYDWSAINNQQAEDRIHRIGQKEIVYWKYILYLDSIDLAVREKLQEKNRNITWVLDPREMIARRKARRTKNLNK